MRYGATTELPPDDIITLAREFFGGELGLTERAQGGAGTAFEGGGGGVVLSAMTAGQATEIDLLAREWDFQAREFLRLLQDKEH